MKRKCQFKQDEIAEKFKECNKAFMALGDETSQLILISLLKSEEEGIRVNELAEKVHLTRAALSHHLKILKDAEIVNVRKEGTKNYYYLDSKISRWETMYELISLIYENIKAANGCYKKETE